MSFSNLYDDPKGEAYSNYALAILSMLREAVLRREQDGQSRAAISARIGMNKSSLSRILNGHAANITIRTISDVLWATCHEPARPGSSAWEDLEANRFSTISCIETIAGAAAPSLVVQSGPIDAILDLTVRLPSSNPTIGLSKSISNIKTPELRRELQNVS